jgi:amino acid adenylation domain-containing protein/thioester reductase-like protein
MSLQNGLATYPLTRAQVPFWLGQTLFPSVELFADSVVNSFFIEGAIDPTLFEKAFQALLSNASALRTIVREAKGIPYCEVRTQVGFVLPLVDFSGCKDPQAEYSKWFEARRKILLNLSVQPFDSALVKLGPSKYVWYLKVHHILVDGRAVFVIFNDMSNYYRELAEITTLQTGAKRLDQSRPFEEFVLAEAEWLKSPKAARTERFWKARVEGVSGTKSGLFETECVATELGADRHAKLQLLTDNEGLFSISIPILATLYCYLSNFQVKKNIRIGNQFLNRTVEFKNTVGLFTSVLPLQIELSNTDTFSAVQAKLQDDIMNCTRHQQYTMLNPMGNRLWDIIFNFYNVDFGDFAGFKTTVDNRVSDYSTYPFFLMARKFEEHNLFLEFNIAKELYSLEERQRLMPEFLALLDKFIECPQSQPFYWREHLLKLDSRFVVPFSSESGGAASPNINDPAIFGAANVSRAKVERLKGLFALASDQLGEDSIVMATTSLVLGGLSEDRRFGLFARLNNSTELPLPIIVDLEKLNGFNELINQVNTNLKLARENRIFLTYPVAQEFAKVISVSYVADQMLGEFASVLKSDLMISKELTPSGDILLKFASPSCRINPEDLKLYARRFEQLIEIVSFDPVVNIWKLPLALLQPFYWREQLQRVETRFDTPFAAVTNSKSPPDFEMTSLAGKVTICKERVELFRGIFHCSEEQPIFIAALSVLLSGLSSEDRFVIFTDLASCQLPLLVDIENDRGFHEFVTNVDQGLTRGQENVDFLTSSVLKEFLKFASVCYSSGPANHLDKSFDLAVCQKSTISGGVHFEFVSPNRRIDHESLRMLGRRFEQVIEAVALDPAIVIKKLPLVLPEESKKLLIDWNSTAQDYGFDGLLHELVERQAAKTPERIAVHSPQGEYTYAQLNVEANRIAALLQKTVSGSGKVVLVCIERSYHLVISCLGCLKAGTVFVPVDPETPEDRIVNIVNDARPGAILICSTHSDKFAKLGLEVLLADRLDGIEPFEQSGRFQQVSPHESALGIYTSGSTGIPKCGLNTHRAFVNHILWCQSMWKLTENDSMLSKAAVGWDVGVWEIFWPISVGARLVVVKPEGQRDLTYLINLICNQKITAVAFVSSMLKVFLEDPRAGRCTTLRLVIGGGEVVPSKLKEEFVAKFSAALHAMYGPSECTAFVCCPRLNEDDTYPIMPIGRPVANTQLFVLDKNLRLLPPGVVGELVIGGHPVGNGYLNRDDLTHDRFVDSPFEGASSRKLYRSGDFVKYRSDGVLDFVGRKDHQVKIRGFRIEIAEIESSLATIPWIRHAAVIVQEGVEGGKVLVAYLSCREESDFSENEIRNYLESKLPSHMIPAVYVFLDHLPMSRYGKIDRKAIPLIDLAKSSFTEYIAPANEIESLLCEVFVQVLKVERIGVQDNYFHLGGDSLRAMQIVVLGQERGLDVRTSDIFHYPTIRALALSLADRSERKPLAPASRMTFLKTEATVELAPHTVVARKFRQAKSVLVTGATGFLGSHLMLELLAKEDVQVHCLVRTQDGQDPMTALKSKVSAYFPWNASVESRISAVSGDFSEKRLGMSSADYERLVGSVDAIYHMGAQVNHLFPYEVLKKANCTSMEEVLRFCADGSQKEVYYASSISIGVQSEDGDLDTVKVPNRGYDESKWVGERIAVHARSHGYPVTVFRPGLMTWNNKTGASNALQRENIFIRAVLEMCMIPTADVLTKLYPSLTPVNVAAKWIVDLSRDPGSQRGTYHIFNPTIAPWHRIVECIKALGIPLRTVSIEVWMEKLRAIAGARERSDLQILLVFMEIGLQMGKQPPIGFELTREALQRCSSLECGDPCGSLAAYLEGNGVVLGNDEKIRSYNRAGTKLRKVESKQRARPLPLFRLPSDGNSEVVHPRTNNETIK